MIRRLPLRYVQKLLDKAEGRRQQAEEKAEQYRRQMETQGEEPDESRIQSILNGPGTALWLADDCAGYKRGRPLDESMVYRIIEKGYETLWIADHSLKRYEEMDGKHADLMVLRNRLLEKISDLFIDIDEKAAGKQKAGSKIDLLEGEDLLSLRLSPLHKEGAARLARKIFGENGSRLEPIRMFVEKIYSSGYTSINQFDNRTLGNVLLARQDWTARSEVSDYLIKHSVAVGIYFTLTIRNLQTERMQWGAQSSKARYTAGQTYKRDQNVAHSQDVVDMACVGAFLYDIGFNHLELKSLLQRGMRDLVNADTNPEKHGFSVVNEDEYKTLKKHVNVGYHLIQNLGVDKTAIIANLMRMHHTYLNGEGYPPRKGEEYSISVGEGSSSKMVKVFKYKSSIHELANLLSIIDTYDAMLHRRPWRLPFSRHDATEYLYNNSVYRQDLARGQLDREGVTAFSGNIHRDKKFDRYLVDAFLRTVRPYAIGEAVPLLNSRNHERVAEAVVQEYSEVAHRPVVRVKLRGQEHRINLAEEKAANFYLGEYIDTTNSHKIDRESLEKAAKGGT